MKLSVLIALSASLLCTSVLARTEQCRDDYNDIAVQYVDIREEDKRVEARLDKIESRLDRILDIRDEAEQAADDYNSCTGACGYYENLFNDRSRVFRNLKRKYNEDIASYNKRYKRHARKYDRIEEEYNETKERCLGKVNASVLTKLCLGEHNDTHYCRSYSYTQTSEFRTENQ